MTAFALEHGDCIDGMSRLPEASVDLIVTSPPYNLGISYSQYCDRAARGSYLDWSEKWAVEARRILGSEGSLFLNIGSAPSNPLLPHEMIMRLRSLFVLQNTIHWIKAVSLEEEDGTALSRGHFKPINSRRFLNDCHEYIFHLTPEGTTPLDRLALGVPYQDKSNIARWSHTGGSDLRCRGNTWFVPYKTIKSRDKQRPHPATFPIELAENCIKLHGIERVEIMLDPFLGIGNSAVAAQQCGVPKFIGFEIDETYFTEAKRRLA
ncbi:MAG: site-specific DNA-methyltransferase [Verrucomicrobiota bacterium]|nr:site-specific DNA-methyltransferase [Verrucomicrobiota bacterium]